MAIALLAMLAIPVCAAETSVSTETRLPALRPADVDSSAAPRSLAEFPPARARAWQQGLVRPDRMEHMGLSFALTSALIVATRSQVAGACATLSLGLAKELWDRHSGSGFDATDLVADATGVSLALVCVRAHGD